MPSKIAVSMSLRLGRLEAAEAAGARGSDLGLNSYDVDPFLSAIRCLNRARGRPLSVTDVYREILIVFMAAT